MKINKYIKVVCSKCNKEIKENENIYTLKFLTCCRACLLKYSKINKKQLKYLDKLNK